MREQILELLNKNGKALAVGEINNLLGFATVDQFKELMKTLNELEDNLAVYKTNKDKYMIFENSNLKIGVLLATKKNFGFVDIEGDEDVFIPPSAMNGAIHKDKVVVEITSKKGSELEGRIVRIVERILENMVGEVVSKDNKLQVILDNEKIKLTVILDKDKTLGAMEGHKVFVKLGAKIGNNIYLGEVIKILGHKNDPGVDILSIVYKYSIPDQFSEEVMKELDDISDTVSNEEIKTRINNGGLDLREEVIFTIDGDDTKDIDDAISIEKLDNGNYKLGVHIADVSYYVKDNTKLNEEAYLRGTSVYLADRVIPMLPHKLSNGICSLNPNVERLAMSCIMEIDHKGNVVTYDIKDSIIKSRIQMTYKKVNQILESNIVPEGYEEYADKVRLMEELAAILRKNKVNRGYIDFDIDEAKIIVNETGEAIDVVLRERGMGEKLIEDFMIAANETVATCIYFMELPFLYRVHGAPNQLKIKNFISFVSSLGYQVKGDLKELTPVDMQKLLDSLRDKKEFHILSNLLLRSMQKAIYDKNNIGHFGLGSKCYTHFTSPIRRYPDTTVHKLLRRYLFEKNFENLDQVDLKMSEVGLHTSERERASIECEREVDDMKKAEYMMKHIGERFTGMISSITSFGMFVELPNLVEGLIKLEELKDDYYEFDQSTITLRGKRTKNGYRLGDNVDIIVSGASKESKTVDFVPATEVNLKKYVVNPK